MAFTITNILETAEVFVANVEADADADVGPLNVPHGLQAFPNRVTLTPLLVEFYLSNFIVSGVDADNIELTKVNAVGSGTAGDQVRIIATLGWLPTDLVRQPDRGTGDQVGAVG